MVKKHAWRCGRLRRPGFNPWVGKILWRRACQPTPVFLPGVIPWTEEPGGLWSTGVTKSWTRLSTPTSDMGRCARVDQARNKPISELSRGQLFANEIWRDGSWGCKNVEGAGGRKGLMALWTVRKRRLRSWEEDWRGTSGRKGEGKERGLVIRQERTSHETQWQDPAVQKGVKTWTGVHRVRSVTS